MSKKADIAALKKAGYSLLNPPDPRSDYYPSYLLLVDKPVKKKKTWRNRKNKKAAPLTPEQIADRKERRRIRNRRRRVAMVERYANKSQMHSFDKESKATGKTIAQLIVESWG